MLVAERHIRTWLETFVVGLDLCPFARPLLDADNLRISICGGNSHENLQRAFLTELDLLQCSSEQEIATALLVFPDALSTFDDYLDFLDDAQGLLVASGLDELIQLASFHPRYQFDGQDFDAPGNFSNRSPYPVLHLLRESMLTRVLNEFPQPDQIPVRNVRVLEDMGLAELQEKWKNLFDAG